MRQRALLMHPPGATGVGHCAPTPSGYPVVAGLAGKVNQDATKAAPVAARSTRSTKPLKAKALPLQALPLSEKRQKPGAPRG